MNEASLCPAEICRGDSIHRQLLQRVTWVTSIASFLLLLWLFAFNAGFCWSPSKVTDGPYGNDFLQEWIGGHLVRTGQADQIYDSFAFDLVQHDAGVTGMQWNRATYYPPVYPPPHYWLSATIAAIPYRYALGVWMIAMAVAFVVAIVLSFDTFGVFAKLAKTSHDPSRSLSSQAWFERWWWFGFLAAFPPVYFSLIMAQKATLWMLVIAGSWWLLSRQRNFVAGAFFGLLSVKPTLFFLLPLFLLRNRNWSFFLGATLTTLLIWGGAWYSMPNAVWLGFLQQAKMTSSYAALSGYHLDWSCNLMSLAYAAKPQDVLWLKWSLVFPLSLYVLAVCFLHRKRDPASPESLLLVLLATTLLSPHAYFYDLAILLVPTIGLFADKPRRALYCLLSISGLVILSNDVLEYTGIPVLPILVLGLITELHFSDRVAATDTGWFSRNRRSKDALREAKLLA
jgi:hypothetical protein